MSVVCALTVNLRSFQTSPGKDLSNGRSLFCVFHSTSNPGSSKLLQQHAKATAVAFAFDPTSSYAISLRISSTLRHGCIDSGERVQPMCQRRAETWRLTVNDVSGMDFECARSPELSAASWGVWVDRDKRRVDQRVKRACRTSHRSRLLRHASRVRLCVRSTITRQPH